MRLSCALLVSLTHMIGAEIEPSPSSPPLSSSPARCPNPSGHDFSRHILGATCPVEYDEMCERPELYNRRDRVHCSHVDFLSPSSLSSVDVMSTSELLHFTKQRDSIGRPWCMITIFYSPSCHFSARVFEFIDALPLTMQPLKVVAVDASGDEFKNFRFNSRYGITGTPSILLWRNGMAIARLETRTETWNHSFTGIVDFVRSWTDVEYANIDPTSVNATHTLTVDDSTSEWTQLAAAIATLAASLVFVVAEHGTQLREYIGARLPGRRAQL